MDKTAIDRRVAAEVRVVLPARPVGEATLQQLQDWLESSIRAENHLAGFRAGVLAELTRRQHVTVSRSGRRISSQGNGYPQPPVDPG